MGYEDHKHLSPATVGCAVVIISDSRTLASDESGKLLQSSLSAAGHRVTDFALLKNDPRSIHAKIEDLLAAPGTDAIITSGGTGVSCRDITIETITPFLEKKMDGFGELFRHLTYAEIGTGSVLSRAMAGVSRGKVVICLPGSVKAVRLALDGIILPEIGHMAREAAR